MIGRFFPWGVAVLYGVIFTVLGADRYLTHNALTDTGLFTQTIASAFTTFSNPIEGVNHFAYHFSPILYLCAPLLILARSPIALIAIQAFLAGLALPPLYYIVRRRAPQGLARAVVLIGALYPPLAGATFTDFHENAFVPAATLWMLWAYDGRRWRWAWLAAGILLATKEDQGLLLAWFALCIGIVALRARDGATVRFALGLGAVSLALCATYFAVLQPHLASGELWQPARFFAWKPEEFWTRFIPTIGMRVGYLALVLVPLAFLPLFSGTFVFALGGLAECLLSRETYPFIMGQHYAAVWIGYVLFAFALAAAKLAEDRPRGSRRVLVGCAALCMMVFLVANPLHPGRFLRPLQPRDLSLDRVIASLPPELEVGTQEEAYSHLGFDPHATLGLASNPRYVLLDEAFPQSVQLQWARAPLARGIAAGRYKLMLSDGSIELYGPSKDRSSR